MAPGAAADCKCLDGAPFLLAASNCANQQSLPYSAGGALGTYSWEVYHWGEDLLLAFHSPKARSLANRLNRADGSMAALLARRTPKNSS